jgi:hypothetical protein
MRPRRDSRTLNTPRDSAAGGLMSRGDMNHGGPTVDGPPL